VDARVQRNHRKKSTPIGIGNWSIYDDLAFRIMKSTELHSIGIAHALVCLLFNLCWVVVWARADRSLVVESQVFSLLANWSLIDCSSSDVKKCIYLFLFWMLDLFFASPLPILNVIYSQLIRLLPYFSYVYIKYTICGEVLLSQLHSMLLFAAFCLMPIWSRTCKFESSMQILTLLSVGLQLHPFFAAFYSLETYEWLCARSAN